MTTRRPGPRLTETHRALIRVLAAAAIEQFFAESESASETEVAPADEHREVAR